MTNAERGMTKWGMVELSNGGIVEWEKTTPNPTSSFSIYGEGGVVRSTMTDEGITTSQNRTPQPQTKN